MNFTGSTSHIAFGASGDPTTIIARQNRLSGLLGMFSWFLLPSVRGCQFSAVPRGHSADLRARRATFLFGQSPCLYCLPNVRRVRFGDHIWLHFCTARGRTFLAGALQLGEMELHYASFEVLAGPFSRSGRITAHPFIAVRSDL